MSHELKSTAHNPVKHTDAPGPSRIPVTFQDLFLAQSTMTFTAEETVSHHLDAPLEEHIAT